MDTTTVIGAIAIIVVLIIIIALGNIRERRLAAAYTPAWIPLMRPGVFNSLESLGKTPADRYIASVELEDGTKLRSVIFECSYASKNFGENQVRAVWNRGLAPVDPRKIVNVSACPDRVPNSLCTNAVNRGESGMGYYRLNLQFKDGTRISNFVCDCPDIIDNLPAPHRIEDIKVIDGLSIDSEYQQHER